LKKESLLKRTKIERTVLIMTTTEKRQFQQYLACPLFNEREDLRSLLQWLLHHGIESQEKTWAHIYPGIPFSNQRFRLLLSGLQQQAERFLAWRQWQKTPAAEKEWAQIARQRNLNTHFPEALSSAKEALERQPLRNSDYYMQRSALLWEEARFESVQQPDAFQYLNELSDNADLIWLTQKLRYLCLMRAQKLLYQSNHTMRFQAEVEAMVQQHNLLEIPAIAVWYYCLKMLEVPEKTEYFDQFKNLILSQIHLFDRDETRDMHLFAVNYCIRQANAGQRVFLHTIMEIYKDALQKGYLLDNGVMSRFTYHNIVTTGLQTREFEWVEGFIHEYKNALERTYRESSFSFNRARLEFNRKRYDVVLPLLQHSNYYDPLLSLAAKTMSLKIYFETNEYDLLHSHLEAMKNYIRRKSTLSYHKTHYLHLIQFTEKLISLNRRDIAAVKNLRNAIQSAPALMEREWLLAQLPVK
jgi:hypothetical protein